MSWLLVTAAAQAQDAASEVWLSRGMKAYEGRNYATAYRELSDAVGADSRDPRIYYFRGLSSLAMGSEAEAASDFARGVKLESSGSSVRSSEVNRSLQRVQGEGRRTLERYRTQARLVAMQQRSRLRQQLAMRLNPTPQPILPTPKPSGDDAAGDAKPAAEAATAPAKPAADDPFAAPSAPPAAMADKPAAPAADPFSAPAPPAAAAPSAPPAAMVADKTDGSPEGAVKAFLDATAAGNGEALWASLPAAYQEQVNGLVQEFGAKMDPELWTKVMGLFAKVGKLGKEKKAFIVAHPAVAGKVPNLEQVLDGAAGVLETLTSSELASADGLKEFDGATFAAGSGAKLLQQFAALGASADGPGGVEALKSAKITVVEPGDEAATVKIEIEGAPPRDQKLKKVEGKWLPAEMVDGWEENMAKAKAGLAGADMTAQKPQAMMMLGMVEKVADDLLAAPDEQAFQNVINNVMAMVGPMLGPLMGGAGGMPGAAPPGAAPPPEQK
jgi:hypothetical protein